MKRIFIILPFLSILYSQDTLVTKKGKIYSGTIIKDDSKYIEFQPQNWNTTTKIAHSKIDRLVSRHGKVLIETKNKNSNKKSDAKANYSNENVELNSKTVYNNLFVSNILRPSWNFHEPKDPFKAGILSIIMPSGGHIYNEQYSKGLFYLFAVPALYVSGGLIFSNNVDKDDELGALGGILVQFTAVLFHFYNAYLVNLF